MTALVDALTAAGIHYADVVVQEAQRHNVPVELICVMLIKESGGGRHVWGHDPGAYPYAPRDVTVPVTQESYQEYRASLAAGGVRNGIGPGQVTHWSIQDAPDVIDTLWKPETAIFASVREFARLYRAYGEWGAFERYRGIGPGAAYADHAMTLLPKWRQLVQEAPMSVLVIQMGHVGRPPRPGSVGTAGEQEFTKRAGAACASLLSRDGWTVRVIDADPNYESHQSMGGTPSSYRGDAFVAIHCDGSTNPDRDGASFGYRTPEGNAFAQAIKAAYLRRTGRPASWLEPDNYTTNLSGYYGTGLAVGQGNRRAVIFESGFLTNPTDRAMLTGPDGPNLVALAIGDALGIATNQETTVTTPAQIWAHPQTSAQGYTYTTGQWLTATAYHAEVTNGKVTALGPPIARIEAKVDQLLALHAEGGRLDEAALEQIRVASEEAAERGAREGASAEILARLDVLQEQLNADDKEQALQGARDALGELRRVLNPEPPAGPTDGPTGG